MKKLLAILVVVAIAVGAVVPVLAQTDNASACTNGLTPGYWKNHKDLSPAAFSTDPYFDEWFAAYGGVPLSTAYATPPHARLSVVLATGGGKFTALNRHAAAALLNSARFGAVEYYSLWYINHWVHYAYSSGDWESVKDSFEDAYSWQAP
jgi:hypothetical protein